MQTESAVMFSLVATGQGIPSVGRFSTRQRRRERRVSHRVPCRVRLLDAVVPGEIVNVSIRGLAVHVGAPAPAGAPVELWLPTTDGQAGCLIGYVVHTRRVLSGTFELGIRCDEA
jgi:hypothetical protein